MNEILKQHNDLVDLPLRNFNPSEMDILLAICYKCQNEGTNKIILHFDQIRQLSHFQSKDNKRLVDLIMKMNRKLLDLNILITNEEKSKIRQMVLFRTFEIDTEEKTLTVKVNEDFSYLLNDFTGNYTAVELQESVQLKSTYAKAMYKQLRRFRFTGKWAVSMEFFRMYLDIPPSYSTSDIDRDVLAPAVKELGCLFDGLTYEKQYRKKEGKGRPRVDGYIFSFTRVNRLCDSSAKTFSVDNIAKLGEWRKLRLFCPVCKKRVYEKRLQNENGEYSLYGHPDFKTGGCSWTSTSAGDCIPEERILSEQENSKREEQFTENEMKENREKLRKMFADSFK